MTLAEIENTLRHPPRIHPPAALLSDLQRQIVLPSIPTREAFAPGWKRWFPALSFGLLIFLSVVALGIQTQQLILLRNENEVLRETAQSLAQPTLAAEANANSRDEQEIQALRAEVERLRQNAQVLAELRAEHDRLQTQFNAAAAKQAVEDPFAAHKARADSFACLSNLKNIALAAILCAKDQGYTFPPDMIPMRRHMKSPQLLVCPSDPARGAALTTWEEVNFALVSYEYLAANTTNVDPNLVLARCRIHDRNVAVMDGSAHTRATLVTENGRLRLEPSKP